MRRCWQRLNYAPNAVYSGVVSFAATSALCPTFAHLRLSPLFLPLASAPSCPLRNSINCMKFVAEQTFYTGDDAGYIKMWDLRKSLIKPVHTMRDNVDQITCLEADDHSRRVFATSLDGCMTIIDVRSKKKDPIEDVIGPMKKNELTCVAVLDRGMHVTVGTSKGTIFVWKHGAWRAPRTSIKGHPEDIHCFLKASEQHILTGSADGAIRYLRILPENERSFDKLVAHHKEQDLDVDVDFGIEAMRFNFNKRWLAYISHDSCIHWADVSKLEDPDSFVCQSEPRVKGAKRVAKARKKKKGSEPEAPAEVSASVVVPWYLANGDDAVDGGGDNTANTDSIGTSGGCTGGGAGDGDGDGDASSQEDSNSDAGAAAPPPKKEKKKRKKVFSDDDSDASSEAEKPKKSKKKAAKVLHMGKPTSVRRMFFASL